MLLKSFILHNSKRLKLKGIKTLKIDFTTKTHHILGTHGAGKSSTMDELSVYPSDKNHFYEGGYKELVVEHLGKTYRIVSGTEGHHIFNEKDVDLNDSGNTTTQKKLVAELFGYNLDLHRLLVTDSLQFTELSPPQRKDWLMKMSRCNHDYAINVYQKSRKRLKEIESTLTYLEQQLSRIVRKRDDLANSETIDVDLIRRSIEYLNKVRVYDFKNVAYSKEDFIKDTQRIEKTLNKLTVRYSAYFGKRDTSYLEKRIMEIDHILKHSLKEYTKLTKKNESLKKLLQKNPYSETHIRALKEEQSTIKTTIAEKITHVPNYLPNYQDTSPEIIAMFTSEFRAIIDRFPEKFIYRRDEHLSVREKLETLKYQRTLLENEQLEVRESNLNYKRLNEHKLTCPKCTHTWAEGVDEATYQKSLNRGAEIDNQLKNLKVEAIELDKVALKYTLYIEMYGRLKTLIVEKYNLPTLWEHLVSEVLPASTSTYINFTNHLIKSHSIYDELFKLNGRMEALTVELGKNTAVIDVSQVNLKEQMDECAREMEVLMDSRDQLVTERNRLQSDLSEFKNLRRQITQLSTEANNTLERYKLAIEATYQKRVTAELTSLNKTYMEHQQRTSTLEGYEATIIDLQSQIKALEERHVVVSEMRDKLSPKSGLIAKNLVGFINQFISTVNQRIADVWPYSMVLQPPTFDEETTELNYLFPIIVENETNTPVKDIRLGSGAMKEMINLSFKLTAIDYLQLNDWPLHIDELGHRMSPEYKRMMYEMIYRLSLGGKYSNIFMISHDVQCYDSFGETNITYLGERDELTLDNNSQQLVNSTSSLTYR